jgi:hypothetical protein
MRSVLLICIFSTRSLPWWRKRMGYQGSGHSDFLWISGSGAAGLGCEAALASAGAWGDLSS